MMSERHSALFEIPNFLHIVFNSPGYFPLTVVTATAKIKPKVGIKNETEVNHWR